MSQGLKIPEAHDLFRDYVDDPDATFITTAQVQRYLEFGLDQWRQIIREANPHVYGAICEFSTGTTTDSSYPSQVDGVKPFRFSLDLDSNLLRSSLANGNQKAVMGPNAIADWYNPAGSTLVHPPIDTILDLYTWNPDQKNRIDRFRQVDGAKAQELSMFSWTYYLDGNVLFFNNTPPTNMILEFLPVPRYTMDYANTNLYIEGNLLPQFHELVVLLAAKRYMIRDQNVNELLLREMASQVQMMTDYLTKRRLMGSNDSVLIKMSF